LLLGAVYKVLLTYLLLTYLLILLFKTREIHLKLRKKKKTLRTRKHVHIHINEKYSVVITNNYIYFVKFTNI